MTSLTQTIGSYSGFTGNGGVSYDLGRGIHFTTRLEYRQYEIGQSNFERNQTRVLVGFSFSPGDLPLAFW